MNTYFGRTRTVKQRLALTIVVALTCSIGTRMSLTGGPTESRTAVFRALTDVEEV